MKNTFKKVAAVVLAVLMCVSAMVPTFAADATCPGKGNAHTTSTCSYELTTPKDATCLNGGAVMAKCKVCQDSFVVSTTAALGHDWKMPTVTCKGTNPVKVCVRPGCAEEQKALTNVEQAATAPVTETSHAWGAWALSGVSVCTAGERVVRECTLCDASESYYISNEGHYYELASYIAPSSCEVDGVAKYVCVIKGCGATKEMKIEATEESHTYVSWAEYYKAVVPAPKDPNAKTATCAAAGSQTVVCKDCARTAVIAIPQLTTHAWNTTNPMKENAPTCTEAGNYEYYRCTFCLTKGFNYNELDVANGTNLYDDVIVVIDEEDFNEYVVIPSWHENYKVLAGGEVLPTCTKAGTRIVACGNPDTTKACDWTETRTLAALGGHVYYPDVTDVAKQEAIREALGITAKWSTLDDFGKPATGATSVTATGDQAKIWVTYTPANCEEDAVVVWKCLNCAKAELDADNDNDLAEHDYVCTETKEATPDGADFVKFGHNYPTAPESNTATCVKPGIKTFKCKTCQDTKIETVAALGHWLVVDTVTPATCKADGKITYKCINGTEKCSGFVAADYEETIAKTAADHNYEYHVGNDVWESWNEYTGPTPTCLASAKVTRRCAETDCAAHAPAEVEIPATGHEYLDTKDATVVAKLAELIKNQTLVMDSDGIISIGTNGTIVAKCTKVGGCEGGAEYTIPCQNSGCVFFETFKIEEGFGGGHNKVYINGTAVAATATTPELSNKWYCKNSFCENFFETYEDAVADMEATDTADTNPNEVGVDIISAPLHEIWDEDEDDKGRAVTYKDVPYAAIKDAKSADKAQEVEAPVDAKGNVTNYIAVPGTTLVWVFAYEADNHADYSVTKGGFICTCCTKLDATCVSVNGTNVADHKCTNEYTAPTITNGNTTTTNAPASEYTKSNHNYAADTTVGDYVSGTTGNKDGVVKPTCKTHGYTVMTCTDGDCFASYQTGYKPVGDHAYGTTVNIDATCVLTGYSVSECSECGDVKTETEAALGHKNAAGKKLDAVCDGDRETNRACVNAGCGLTIKKTVHYSAAGTTCPKCQQIVPAN